MWYGHLAKGFTGPMEGDSSDAGHMSTSQRPLLTSDAIFLSHLQLCFTVYADALIRPRMPPPMGEGIRTVSNPSAYLFLKVFTAVLVPLRVGEPCCLIYIALCTRASTHTHTHARTHAHTHTHTETHTHHPAHTP
jgi:hypothetical protein